MTPLEPRWEYDAFISYRHVPRDMQIAEHLHKALETYRTPRYLVKKGAAPRLNRIFRDREELPTSGDLGHDIESALLASRFLVVICSPEAIQSQWVLREVDFFGQHHGYDKILTLLVEGEPADAFPPSLIRSQYDDHGVVSRVIEPLAADIRPVNGSTAVKLLKTEKLRLLASILGCKYDDLRQREHERRVRRITTLSASATAFLLAITAFTLWQLNAVSAAREVAVQNEQIALQAKDRAQQSEQDTLGAQSDLYASLALKAADGGDRMLGMSLAMGALPQDMVNPERPLKQEAKDALYYTAAQSGIQERTYLYPPTDTADDIAWQCFFNAGNGDIVTVGSRTVRQYDGATGRLRGQWQASQGYVILAVNPGADRAIIVSESMSALDVQLWDIPQNSMVMHHAFGSGNGARRNPLLTYDDLISVIKAGFETDGKRFFIACNWGEKGESGAKRYIGLYDATSGSRLDTPGLSVENEITDIIINAGQLLVVSRGDDPAKDRDILVYDIKKNLVRRHVNADDVTHLSNLDQERSFGITSDGKKLAFFTWNTDEAGFMLNIIDLDTGEAQQIKTDDIGQISSDGNKAAFFTKDENNVRKFIVQDLQQNKPLVVLENTTTFEIPAGVNIKDICMYAFCSNGNNIVFEDAALLDIEHTELYALPLQDWSYAESDASGKYLAYLDYFGKAAVIQLKDPSVDEVVIPSENEVAIQGDSVLLFEDTSVAGTLVRRWDAAQKTVSFTAHEERDVASLCEINNDMIGFKGTQTDFSVYDADTGRAMSAFHMDGQFHDFQLDPSGKLLLVNKHGIESDDGVFLFDAQTGRQIRKLSGTDIEGCQSYSMRCAGFLPGAKYCWSAEYPKGIVIYDIGTGKAVTSITIGLSGDYSALTSPDGSRMLLRPMNNMQLWSIEAQTSPVYLSDLKGESVVCLNDSLVVTDVPDIYTHTLYIYDIKTGQQKASIRLPDAHGYKGILINGGKNLLTITESCTMLGTIHMVLWDCSTGKAVATLYNDYSKGAKILYFSLVNGGKEIVVVSEYYGKTYIRTIPYYSSFDQVYAAAKEKLAGRVYDQAQDLEHIQ